MRMKKIGLLGLALVLALALTGAGFAVWNESMAIGGTVNTGDADAGMKLAKNSYGAAYYGNPTSPPPYGYAGYVELGYGGTDDGNWDSIGQKDNAWGGGLAMNCPAGPIVSWWGGDKEDGKLGFGPYTACTAKEYLTKCDAGVTAIALSDWDSGAYYDTMTFTINHAYPQYVTGASFVIKNTGDVPIELAGLTVTSVAPELYVAMLDFPPYERGMAYEPWHCWVLNNATGTVIVPEESRYVLCPGEEVLTGLYIEVLDTANQNSSYGFSIKVNYESATEPTS